MSNSALSILALTAVLVGILVWHRWSLKAIDLLQMFEYHSNLFFQAADPLIDDDQTPDTGLRILRLISDDMGRGNSARRLLFTLISRPKNKASVDRMRAEMNVFFDRRPELEESFRSACENGLLAMTYRDFFWGGVVRRFLMADAGPAPELPRTYVYRFEGSRSDDCDNHQHPIAA